MPEFDQNHLKRVRSFNETDRNYRDEGLAVLIAEQVIRSPEHIALEYAEHSYSYKELARISDSLAAQLTASGVGPDVRVGICADRSDDLIISILAVIKSGGAYVPIDPSLPGSRINFIIEDSEPEVILIHRKYSPVFQGKRIIEIDDLRNIHNEFSDHEGKSTPGVTDNLAYVMYTSGSTGSPKGVAMHQKPLSNLVQWHLESAGRSMPMRTLQFAPFSFDVSFQEIFTCLAAGGTLVIIDEETRLNQERLFDLVSGKKIEQLFLPYVALQEFCHYADFAGRSLPFLKNVVTAGEQLVITNQIREFFIANPGCKLHNHYGPTETHVVTSFTLSDDPDKWPDLPPVGRPIANARIYLLNEQGEIAGPREKGEICVAGDVISNGYLNNKELTDQKFISIDVPDVGTERVYRTGDIGRFDKEWNLEFSGRTDDQLKVRGYRVEPGEIESVISSVPGVRQNVVIPHADNQTGQRLISYFATTGGADITPGSLRKAISDLLPDYMIPSLFVELKEFPRTASGKIDRKSLPDPGHERPDTGTLYVEPGSLKEKLVAGLWKELLGISSVGIDDNFFELGGNSLLALRFITQVGDKLGENIPVTDIFTYPTIRSLIGSVSVKVNQDYKATSGLSSDKPSASNEPIAIIGMAAIFPGAPDIRKFWENLKGGVESVSFFTEEELDRSIPDEQKSSPDYVRARGIIDDAYGFDAGFFNINPGLAELMDPQQRIFLETAWHAMEDAGYVPGKYQGLTGVFAGVGNNSYYINNVLAHHEKIAKVGSFQVMTANEKDYTATRVSHFMNLMGPAVSIHTACSTSLVAVIMACDSLRTGGCDVAIAGGASVTSPVISGHLYQEGGMHSIDGHTRPFDKNSSGTVFSDGSGAVVLKRYRDAVEDGDAIYAMIRGTGMNNDGSDKASFTAPSVNGQAGAISMAHEQSGFDPDTISYIEAHGTATPIGDPIEIEALKKAFNSNKKGFCAIGTVKSNFGHLTAASGVAGLIKTALQLRYSWIAPSLNYDISNPGIDFEQTPFYVQTESAEWNTRLLPRRAGVSSFGVGGTNAHVVLEEVADDRKVGESADIKLMMISALTEKSLKNNAFRLKQLLEERDPPDLADLCYTLQTGRRDFRYRRFIIAKNHAEAAKLLVSHDEHMISVSSNASQAANGIVFMFPGQGSQYVNMGLSLYQDEVIFRQSIHECCALFGQHLDKDLVKIIYPEAGREEEAELLLNQTAYTQPALFTVGYALSKLWMSWGILPSALIGHSIGEYTAACISGVMVLDDAVKVVAARARLMQSVPEGKMISVRASADYIERIIETDNELSIAAINGSSLCAVSGNEIAVNRISELFDQKDIVWKELHTTRAFHSPMMDMILDPFKEVVSAVRLNKPSIPIMSASSGKWLTVEASADPDYWTSQIRVPVRFAEGIKNIWKDHPSYLMMELGPRNSLTLMARQQSQEPGKQIAIQCLSDTYSENAERMTMLHAIGMLWLNGIDMNWDNFYSLQRRKKVRLPGYSFDRTRYFTQPSVIQSPFDHDPGPKSDQISAVNTVDLPEAGESDFRNRKDQLISELKEIMEDASGLDLRNVDDSLTFLEAGLDSLFLTQTALTISKKYGVKVTFRQLNEKLGSFSLLAQFLDTELPDTKVKYRESPDSIHEQKLRVLLQETAIDDASQDRYENVKADQSRPFGAITRIENKGADDLSPEQKEWLQKFTGTYNEKTAASKEYTAKNRDHLSDPRVVSGFQPVMKELIYQIVVNRSEGSRLFDIDGNQYIDVLNGFGSNFLGYGSEVIKQALQDQLKQGIEIGPQHPLAGEVAALICEFTKFDRAGFCNTGSEAVLGAMRIARTVTGRSLIVCFNGSYHGINDEVIVRGTRKLKSVPAAAGIPAEAVKNILVLDYGTDESLEIIKSLADEIAAVMVEPIQSRRADYQPEKFLRDLRKVTSDSKSLLIFDEVITGFRLRPGGAQEFFGVRADIGTYGKIIGGGMPIGVIAGRRQYMDVLDGGSWKFGDESVPETGVTYFAGTFVRHPLALAAAKAVLLHMKERGEGLYTKLEGLTRRLVDDINTHCEKTGAPFRIVTFGSLFKVKWMMDDHYNGLLFILLRSKGVHIYDGFPCFVTDAFNEGDVDHIVSSFIEATDELMQLGFLSKAETLQGINENEPEPDLPPVSGAMPGKDADGKPRWFIPDPERPGKYLMISGE